MISRDLKLTINNNRATLNEPVTLYMYDRNIQLNIEVINFGFGESIEGKTEEKIKKAAIIVKSPDGKVYKYKCDNIEDNIVKLIIPKTWTDQAEETGDYQIQIQMYDDGSTVTLPPFNITIEKPIFPYDDDNAGSTEGYADKSEIDNSVVGIDKDIKDNSNISDGYYDKTTWVENMLISTQSLNKIEKRLEEIYSGDGLRLTEVDTLSTSGKTIMGAINELKRLIENVRKEMNEQIENLQPIQEINVETISLANEIVTLDAGEEIQMEYEVTPANHNEELIWTTGNTNIATVNSRGLVTGVNKGTTTVFCTAARSGVYTMSNANVEIPIGNITLNEYGISLNSDETFQLEYTLEPADTSQTSIMWESTNSDIVKVDPSGLVTGVSSGMVEIICKSSKSSDIEARCVVEVFVELDSITIVPSILSLNKGDTYDLECICNPTDATYQDVSWSTSNSEIASVDQNGLVTAHKGGSVTITCTSEHDESKTSSCNVLISVPVTGLELANDTITITKGESLSLAYNLSPEDVTQTKVLWSSSNEEVATVDSNGNITILTSGDVTIRCTSAFNPEIYDECILDISVPITGIEFATNSVELDRGLYYNIPYELIPADTTEREIEWYSSNEEIATVDQTGRVVAQRIGSATIYCKSLINEEVITECLFNIIVPITGIEILSDDIITKENTYQLDYDLIPSDTTQTNVEWLSDNPEVATVDSNGLVTRVGYGDVNITCKSNMNSFASDTIMITFEEEKNINDYPIAFKAENSNGFFTVNLNNVNVSDCQMIDDVFVYDPGTNITSVWFTNSNITELVKLDISEITDMTFMFDNCRNLTSVNTSNWDTSDVTIMECMFNGCTSLTSIDTSKWDTNKVTNMANMFSGCNLNSIPDIDTTNVTNMSAMFAFNRNMQGTADPAKYWEKTNPSVTSYGACFEGCTKLNNYSQIPESWGGGASN